MNEWDQKIRQILKFMRNIAIVGLSDKPQKDSYHVAAFLKDRGFKIFPVNPSIQSVLGERSYPDLKSVPAVIDIVNVFRRSDAVPVIADEAIAIRAKVLWLQEGVINEPAAQKAEAAGLTVVQNQCILKEYSRLLLAQ